MVKNLLLILPIIFLILNQTSQKEKSIFDETQIKKMKLKNRLFRGSIGDYCFLKDGKITEEALNFYNKLSDNGVGTIFTGITTISDYDKYENSGIFRIDKDEYINEYKKLTSIVHKNKANIIMQIAHIGAQTTLNEKIIYAPSKILFPGSKKESIEMSKNDILRIENDFVNAAIRAKKSGFDGIEIHAAHFYLLSLFLSPVFNKRNDEYGGNSKNRARIIIEIIEKIRKEVGNDFIISLKINSEDGIENGISEDDFILTCKLAEKSGVDIIQVSGMEWTKGKIDSNVLPFFESAKKVAEILSIPVILIGNIREVDTIQFALNNSKIEYFGIARPLICEVDLVKKWNNGDFKKSNCISCNTCLKKYSTCVFNKNQRLYP